MLTIIVVYFPICFKLYVVKLHVMSFPAAFSFMFTGESANTKEVD